MPHDPAFSPVPIPTLPDLPDTRPAPRWYEAFLILLAYFALQIVLGVGFAWVSHTLAGWFPAVAPATGDRVVLVAILALLGSAGGTLWLVARRYGRLWRDGGPTGIGFTPPEGSQVIWAAVLGIVAPIAGGLLTQFLAGDHNVSQSVSQVADDASVGMRIALLPVAILVGPLAEEVIFRGALLGMLRPRVGDSWAIALSAALFGVVHLPDFQWAWYAIPNLALVGAFCAWLRVRTGSIWPAFICHAANNSLAVLAWFG